MKTSTAIVAALVTIVSCVVPTLADDSKKVTTGKVVLVTPKDDQSLVWLYDLDTVNKLRVTTDEDQTEQRVPSLSYNGNKELTILYTEQDSPGRKDRVDMALIQGNVRDEITSFKYIVCEVGMAAGIQKGVATATITLLNPGPTAGAGAVFVSPTSTADYTASCTVASLPPMKTT